MLYRAYDVKSLLHSGAANALGLRMGMCKYGYLGGFCDGAHASTATCAHSARHFHSFVLRIAVYRDGR